MYHLFRPDASIKSFRDYADKEMIDTSTIHLSRDSWPQVDVILDRYLPGSIQVMTRQRRGQEPDSGCDMMGMGNFRDIGTVICRT